jgi:chromosome partitioning protein
MQQSPESIARIIVFTNRKGGDGKSTSSVSVASGLALRGKKTLLLDTDTQGNSAMFLGIDRDFSAYDALEGRRKPSEFIRGSGRNNLDIIPGSRRTALIESTHRQDGVSLAAALDIIRRCADGYDYLVIDTPPDGYPQELALYCADILVVPVALDYPSMDGLKNTLRAIAEISDRHQRKPESIYILPTFFTRDNESSNNMAELQRAYGDDMVQWPVPALVEARECVACAATIWEYKPNGKVALAYGRLIERIIGG